MRRWAGSPGAGSRARGFEIGRWLAGLGAVILLLAPLGGGPGASPAWARGGLERLVDRVVELTNAERARQGVEPLGSERRLERVAGDHSSEMAALDYFSHESPTPGHRTPFDRLRRAGVAYTHAGENIAYYQGYSSRNLAPRVVADWMNSPGHRANILDPHYECIGVGVATEGDRIYVTQVFAALRR